jgi:hypothetical protein
VSTVFELSIGEFWEHIEIETLIFSKSFCERGMLFPDRPKKFFQKLLELAVELIFGSALIKYRIMVVHSSSFLQLSTFKT